MVKRGILAALLTIGVGLGSVKAVPPQAATAGSASVPAPWATIQNNCLSCHNSTAKTGGLALDNLSPDNIAKDAQIWEAAVRKLRGGLMPPPGTTKRPDKQQTTELIAWLENKIDAAATNPVAGRVAMHRLNRREYENVVRDLIGLKIDASKLLPLDDVKGHFDTDASNLNVSASFVDQYIAAARELAVEAVGNPEAPPVTTTYGDIANMVISLNPRAEPGSARQQHFVEGMPLGTRGGFTVRHSFPADGEYELTIGDMALAREVPKMEFENTVVVLLDGKEFYRTNIGGEPDHKAIDQRLDIAVAEINGRLRKIKFKATAGQHDVSVTFVKRSFAESDERTRTVALEGGQERIQAAWAMQVRGPLSVTGVSASASRQKIFTCQPKTKAEELPCASKIISDLARRAFRRPVTQEDVNPLMAFYKSGSATGSFDLGVREAVMAILASPHFVYRAEAANTQGATRSLSDVELASRLSFFLWSSMPDDELLDLAIKSRLSQPDVLAKQVRRMLADPKAETLVTDFSFQWLNLAKLDEIVPDSRLFPHASGVNDPRALFKLELKLFIDSVLRSDRSVVDLLTADHTYLNERLAMIYGMENVKGDQFRRVTLPNNLRNGLLGKAAILNLTANPNRTSPVLRGQWILERLMGTPPAPPPPGVPTLTENRAGGKPLSVRERIEQHRSKPTCMACHGVMDPLGFALENFDTVGQFHAIDTQTLAPVDTAGVLPDGTPIKGPEDLRKALTARPDQFVQALTENLMTYALGRSVDYHDMPVVRKIVKGAEADKYRFESIVLGVISSDAFRKRDAANQAGGN
jgi:mono/diheme cytochrome c family protein